MKTPTADKVLAEVSLTPATRASGVVWYATGMGRDSRGMAQTATEAVWTALDHLVRGEVTGPGMVRVISLAGDMAAMSSISAVPTYDRMEWRPSAARIEVGK